MDDELKKYKKTTTDVFAATIAFFILIIIVLYSKAREEEKKAVSYLYQAQECIQEYETEDDLSKIETYIDKAIGSIE